MSKKEETRKNFSTKTINEVFEEQGRCCAKCGKSLLPGFHAHHANGNHADNSKENCKLLCAGCHGGEQYETLQNQKKAVIGDLDKLIAVGIEGKASGATIEKLLDAIKLKLSLQRQTQTDNMLEPPAEVKAETYITVMEHGLKEREYGFKEGLTVGAQITKDLDLTKIPKKEPPK